MRRTRACLLAAAATTILLVSCGSSRPMRAPVALEGSKRVPDATLSDWVSYGDHLAVVDVTAERTLPPDATTEKTGEGMVGRSITAKVTGLLWSRPGAPALGKELHLIDVGFAYEHGTTIPFSMAEHPAYRPGHRYVMLLARFEGEWGYIGPYLELIGDSVHLAADVAQQPWVADIRDASVDEIGALLARAVPDPVAAANAALDPDARWAAVRTARHEND